MKPSFWPQVGTKSQANSVYCHIHVGETRNPTGSRENQQKIAEFEFDEAKARSHPKLGRNPLIIKPVQATGTNNSDLIIDETLAQKLAVSPATQELFYNAKVVILTDPLTSL